MARRSREDIRRRAMDENRYNVRRQQEFRKAAIRVTQAFAEVPAVARVVLFGSAAEPLGLETTRYRPYRRNGLRVLHHCGDVDLAVWLEDMDCLRTLNRRRNKAVGGMSVANHQVDVFVFNAATDEYAGRLCIFAKCPKQGKIECMTPGCGQPPFLKQHPGFTFDPEVLDPDRSVVLFDRSRGQADGDSPEHADTPHAASYTNRRGVTYYAHERHTKTGRLSYVARRSAEGALAELPDDREFAENVNGQVSVRTKRPRRISPEEEQQVRDALREHGSEHYRVEIKGRDIIIHEPEMGPELLDMVCELPEPADPLGEMIENTAKSILGDELYAEMIEHKKNKARRELERAMSYYPILRFRLEKGAGRTFTVERMGLLRRDGWVARESDLTLEAACRRHLPELDNGCDPDVDLKRT